VPFPVASYQERITQITQHVRQQLSLAGLLVSQRAGHTVDPDTVIQVRPMDIGIATVTLGFDGKLTIYSKLFILQVNYARLSFCVQQL
jgi:hypothetical protein